MTTLRECIEAGIPVYRFGCAALDALHDEARDPPVRVGTRGEGLYFGGDGACYWRRTYPVFQQTYGAQRHGFRYVVDHGWFHTLNTIERGQVVPRSEFLA